MKILVVDSTSNDYLLISAIYKQIAEVKLVFSGAEAIQQFNEEVNILVIGSDLTDMDSLTLLQKIRSSEVNSNAAILLLSADPSLETKLKAYQFGADEYLVKPVTAEMISDRINVLFQRMGFSSEQENLKGIEKPLESNKLKSKKIVFHSLRGGSGVSTLAVNTAVAIVDLWQAPTIIMDTAFYNGQVAMLLNHNQKKSFADLESGIFSGTEHVDIISAIEKHNIGLSLLAAPRFPTSLDYMNEVFWDSIQATLAPRFEYIVVDTPHDFTDSTISNLIDADVIILVVNPEMSSLRAAVSALRTYKQIGVSQKKIKVILNHNVPNYTIDPARIQAALDIKIDMVIPHEVVEVTKAINIGMPVVKTKPNIPISAKIFDLAYKLSLDEHKAMENNQLSHMATLVRERQNIKS